MIQENGHVTSPKGFQAAAGYAGIRRNPNRYDLALIVADHPCTTAAVYTRNVVQAAPLKISKTHLADGKAQAIIINSGNANCCTMDGNNVALGMCRHVAENLSIPIDEVIVSSTGVIGVPLPLAPIANTIPKLTSQLSRDGGLDAAHAIMTTDTFAKHAATTISINGTDVTIGAIAKGSGMIHPNMGTMLCFATTDADIPKTLMQDLLQAAVDDSFNMVSVDGDTSTNDMVVLMASGAAKNTPFSLNDDDYKAFVKALQELFVYLAKAIAKDGEGATRLLTCQVLEAANRQDARLIARSVVSSNLLKAAIYGADANWGRILCAAGYSGARFNPDTFSLTIQSQVGSLLVCDAGMHVPFDEEEATRLLSTDHVTLIVKLGMGEACAEAYGCDLTCEYVHINGDYRS